MLLERGELPKDGELTPTSVLDVRANTRRLSWNARFHGAPDVRLLLLNSPWDWGYYRFHSPLGVGGPPSRSDEPKVSIIYGDEHDI